MKNKNSFELAVFVVLFLSLFPTLSITANNVLFAQTSTPPSTANHVTYKLHQTMMIPNMSFHATVTLPADFFQKQANPQNFKVLTINGVNTLVYFVTPNEYVIVPFNQVLTANVDRTNPQIIEVIKITQTTNIKTHSSTNNGGHNGVHDGGKDNKTVPTPTPTPPTPTPVIPTPTPPTPTETPPTPIPTIIINSHSSDTQRNTN